MDINQQTHHIIGHCLQSGSKLRTLWSTTCFWWGWSPVLFCFQKLIKDDRSRAKILEQGYPCIWRTCLIVSRLPTADFLELQLIMLLRITGCHVSCNQHLRTPELTGRYWGTTYHSWCTSYSCRQVHPWAVWVWKATPSLGKHMSMISNLERMKA